MELDSTMENNVSTPSRRENSLHLNPVLPDASGLGLPYAPEDWPKKGDIWTWKVGRRVAITGHFLDRYLYPPKRLQKLVDSGRKRGLPSKLSVERYIKMVLPGADINAFFASFSWKVPAKKHSLTNGIFCNQNGELEPTNHQDAVDNKLCLGSVLSISSDYHSEYLKIEYEIDQVLQALGKAQETEYNIAAERLYGQKNYLHHLYQQLEKERSELQDQPPGNEADASLNAVLNRVDQIKYEVMRLKEMEEVANGFGRTPKSILKEYFDLEIED